VARRQRGALLARSLGGHCASPTHPIAAPHTHAALQTRKEEEAFVATKQQAGPELTTSRRSLQLQSPLNPLLLLFPSAWMLVLAASVSARCCALCSSPYLRARSVFCCLGGCRATPHRPRHCCPRVFAPPLWSTPRRALHYLCLHVRVAIVSSSCCCDSHVARSGSLQNK
jgi:hypothetical protein